MTDIKLYRRRQQYKERRIAGICVQCGAKVDQEGRAKCNYCLTRQRENARRKYRKNVLGAHNL